MKKAREKRFIVRIKCFVSVLCERRAFPTAWSMTDAPGWEAKPFYSFIYLFILFFTMTINFRATLYAGPPLTLIYPSYFIIGNEADAPEDTQIASDHESLQTQIDKKL